MKRRVKYQNLVLSVIVIAVTAIYVPMQLWLNETDPEFEGKEFYNGFEYGGTAISLKGRRFFFYEGACGYSRSFSGWFVHHGDALTLYDYEGTVRQFRVTKHRNYRYLEGKRQENVPGARSASNPSDGYRSYG